MKERKCKECAKPIPPEKRLDTEFCCSTCKAKHWKKRTAKQDGQPSLVSKRDIAPPPNADLKISLRGVVDSVESSEPIADTIAERTPEPSVLSVSEQIIKLNAEKKLLDAEQKEVSGKMQAVQLRIEMLNGIIPKGRFSPYVFCDPLEKSQKLIAAQTELEDLKRKQSDLLTQWSKVFWELTKLEKLPAETKSTPKPVVETAPSPPSKAIVTASEVVSPAAPKQSSRVISSKDLREKTYACLNFSGKWFDLIGKPSVVFHAAVHGKPGEGKSTFCFQWAHYLAEEFGKVIYISAEEGFSKTLRDKLINTKADSSSLCFADLRSFNEITTEIGRYDFHFIIIDSLDTLKIDALKLKQLREHYPQSAFITISQSTKDGKMRGSQEIIHDSDIEIRVVNGTASTAKNRFKEKGKTYNVFTEIEPEKKDGRLEPPRNVV